MPSPGRCVCCSTCSSTYSISNNSIHCCCNCNSSLAAAGTLRVPRVYGLGFVVYHAKTIKRFSVVCGHLRLSRQTSPKENYREGDICLLGSCCRCRCTDNSTIGSAFAACSSCVYVCSCNGRFLTSSRLSPPVAAEEPSAAVPAAACAAAPAPPRLLQAFGQCVLPVFLQRG